jgi:predicted transcriptional regulator of viral defense system
MKASYNYITDYLTKIQSKGRYSVTLTELKSEFDTSEKAILQNIYRLKRKNQLAQVRKEFYVIIPPQYFNAGMIPPTLFIADMMNFLNRQYYVGLYSAAALHGAGHQQPMEFQVVIQNPALRSIKNQKLNISFYTKTDWEPELITEKKTETGYLKVSSPEFTAFDLVSSKKIGGLNRLLPILEDLVDGIKSSLLVKSAKIQKIPNIQRLGYLLDIMGKESLANSLYRLLRDVPHNKIRLSLLHKNQRGSINGKWKVIVNTELDY